MLRQAWIIFAIVTSLPVAGCIDRLKTCDSVVAGDRLSCPTPGETDRAFDLAVPGSWDGVTPLPLIYAMHGGAGHKDSANKITCPDGDTASSSCLIAAANTAGYAVLSPNGTGSRPLRNLRTWNAGGGNDGWACVSGNACAAGIDEMAYLDKVHAIAEALIPIDSNRVYVTGLSNGAAISHRLACERSQRFAAIAALSSGNQHEAAGGACGAGTAILDMHGTGDPINFYETFNRVGSASRDGLREGAEDTMNKWAERNGCDPVPLEEALPDTTDDGTTSLRRTWQNCESAVELVRIENGGHTWPGGDLYLSEDTIGLLSEDFSATTMILEFFETHAR